MPYQATEATEATKARRREALLAAATAVVATHGFQRATVKSVAPRADMSVGSVYLYFSTKSDLLAAVFRRSADVELAAVRTAVHDARLANQSGVTATAGATSPTVAADKRSQTAAAELAALVLCFAQRAIKGRQLAWSLLLEPVDRAIDVERLKYRKSYADLVAEIITRGIRTGELTPQHAELSGAAIVGAISEALTGQLSPLHTGDTASTDEVIADITALCLRAVGVSEYATILAGKATS